MNRTISDVLSFACRDHKHHYCDGLSAAGRYGCRCSCHYKTGEREREEIFQEAKGALDALGKERKMSTKQQIAERIIAAVEAYEEGILIADVPEITADDLRWMQERCDSLPSTVSFAKAWHQTKVDFIVMLIGEVTE